MQHRLDRRRIDGTLAQHQRAETLAGTDVHAHRRPAPDQLEHIRQRRKMHGEARLRTDLRRNERAAALDIRE
jgi:hypothetical protein